MNEEEPSFDLKARRIKQLLSSYYGIDPSAEDVASPSTTHADDVSSSTPIGTPKLSSIDSPAFNVDVYVSTMVRSSRIDTLLKKHAELVKEIRALDSDMQMLVYENYNKFITATDTIRSMKSNVDGMGEKMDELRTIMDKVERTSNGVNAKLQTHRDGIEELSRVKSLLQKLQRVIDLPKRMEIAVKQEAFSIAVSNYCEAKPLLKRYGHQGAFRSVAAECEKVIQSIVQKLELKLQNPKADSEECVRLLQQLGADSALLQSLFLTGRRREIELFVEEASSVVSFMARQLLTDDAYLDLADRWKDVEIGDVTLPSFVRNLNFHILNQLCKSAATFNTTFSASNAETQSIVDRTSLISTAIEMIEKYKTCATKAFAVAAIQGATTAFGIQPKETVWPVKEVDDNAFGLGSHAITFGTTEIAEILVQMMTDLQMVECRLPEIEPSTTAEFLIRSCIEHHMTVCFRALIYRVLRTLLGVKKRTIRSQASSGNILRECDMSELHKTYAHLCELLTKGLTFILDDIKKYEAYEELLGAWKGGFIDILQGKIKDLFLTLLKAFRRLAKSQVPEILLGGLFEEVLEGSGSMPMPQNLQEARLFELAGIPEKAKLNASDDQSGDIVSRKGRHRDKCPSGVILLCARLCSFFEITMVPMAVEKMASIFPSGGELDEPTFNPSETIRNSSMSASDLLKIYVSNYGQSLSVMIRQSIAAANWLNHKEPRGPRPICDLVLTRLQSSEKEIVQLIEDGGSRARRKPTPPHGHSRDPSSTSTDYTEPSEGTTLERNVAKLFRQRVHLDRKVEFTQSSIQAAILGCGLKSWIECIRMETLGRAGLQQLQLDILFLRPLVTGFVRGKESHSIMALMEEVISAAMERSVDPSLLESAVVDKILARHHH